MANTKASLTEQNTQTYPSNNSGSITALAVKSFNNNFINAVATLGDTNVFLEPQTFGDVVQVNSDVFANNVYAGNIPYLSGSNTFTGPTNTFSGSVNIQTASIQFLTVDTIVSSSTINNTGSNQLGDSAGDTQTLWGTVNLPSGPLKVTGSVSSTGGFTGSFQGTASFANNATSASYALNSTSASYALSATSASYALNSTNAVSASYASASTSASFASNATSASYASSSTSASYASASTSASFALTASSADDFTVRGELFANELNTISSTVNASTRSVIINGGSNTITSASLSGIFNSTDSQILGKGITDNFESNNNTIIGGKVAVISGSNQSTVLGGSVRMNNLTGSVALARDTAYTASANYTLFTQNIQASGSVNVTGSLLVNGNSVTAAFPFTGSAQISGSLTITNDTDGVVFDIKQPSHTTESIYSMRMGNQADVTESLAVGGNLLLSGSFNNTYRIVIPTTIDNATLTGSLAGTASWANNSVNSISTASVSLNTITFTKGDASTFAITVDTGSGGGGGGMNLGANTFTGSQTLSSSATPASLRFNVSGALASFVTESASTTNGFGNIIFNARTAVNQSGSVIVSGSSNIIFDTGTTLTTPRGLSGIQNIGLVPVYSGSIPTFNQNYLVGTLTASGSKIAFTGNNINGTVTVTENNAASGAINNNIINAGQVVISLNYSGSTGAFGNSINNNNINGSQHLIQIIGSGSQNRQFVGNTIGGQSITASLTTPTGSSNNSGSLLNTFIYGTGLIVSGTQINTNTLHGGAFVGRYNETGSLADSGIVFAVGAGTSNTARKTALSVSASGETLITAAGGGLSSRGNSVFGANFVKIAQNTVNANTTVTAYNASMATNAGNVAGLSTAVIAAEQTNITNGRASAAVGSSYSTINTNSGGGDTNNVLIGVFDSQISGSLSSFTGIYSSTGSFINQGRHSAIIAANNARLENTTGSVALGRDTAYTGSANYTLYTQNIDISGSLTVNGNKQYNFGEFWATSSNTPAAGVSQSVIFDSTGVSAGVATSGSGDLLKITNAGTYNIQFSVQVNTSAGADTLYVWFKKNGANIASSNSKAVLANNTAQLLTVNILDTAAANDYYEIAYQTANGNAQILSEAATGNLPQIPSVITTITQVR